jgi:hypothetical protein
MSSATDPSNFGTSVLKCYLDLITANFPFYEDVRDSSFGPERGLIQNRRA